MALGIGATYSMYTQLPSMHKSLFYWWVPDPTFLHLEAVPTTWPPYDKVAVANFDYTAEQAQVVIAKMVSKDFSALAPRVNSFVDRLTITMDNLNELLFEQKQTGLTGFRMTAPVSANLVCTVKALESLWTTEMAALMEFRVAHALAEPIRSKCRMTRV